MRLILMGPAGSGKGTLASQVCKLYPIVYISTGNMFRGEIAAKTSLGKLAKSYIDKGSLVPDDVTIAMVRKRLEEPDCSEGFLLDGFPRTIGQAESLAQILEPQGEKVDLVLNLLVDRLTMLKRIVGRRVCPNCHRIYNIHYYPPQKVNVCDECSTTLYHRSDDQEEQFNIRYGEYFEKTSPVLEYYRLQEIVVDIDATASPAEVFEEAEPFLEMVA